MGWLGTNVRLDLKVLGFCVEGKPRYKSFQKKCPRTSVSKSNIPHCALLVRQVRATLAWYAGYMTHIVREFGAWHMRQIPGGCVSHPRIRRKCSAHLPREECATRDVGPLCISLENMRLHRDSRAIVRLSNISEIAEPLAILLGGVTKTTRTWISSRRSGLLSQS
jgi:hypothetical protein